MNEPGIWYYIALWSSLWRSVLLSLFSIGYTLGCAVRDRRRHQ